ncbi:hypothetical protein HNQ91_000720 [Filimonas zeae]|uniref:hypothetical protein n=1 Tax=Filimonas zeae TaxID=1737353 RepID=UPI001667D52D|nr:hypothetical protein [Filimonas zeae]MDR6337698.1 hypothetical protein [Filimonas zeae]
MYYVLKFSDSWSLYDVNKNQSRPLEKEEVNLLRQLFPGVLSDKILQAVAVSSIQPNKLTNLPVKNTPPTGRTAGEPHKTTAPTP